MGNSSDEKPDQVYVTDCEGPISKNDNAFEIAKKFLPAGGELFTLLSQYDDVKSKIIQNDGYDAGSTLKFILPFLKAYGVDDDELLKFSQENISIVSGAGESLDYINSVMPIFVVSTSYNYYIDALCKKFDFSFERTYSTEVSLDDYSLEKGEKSELIDFREKIGELNRINFSPNAENLNDLSVESQETIRKLDEIFERRLPDLKIGNILEGVKPVGGRQKAESIREISRDSGVDYGDMVYVGDSITDVEAFQTLQEGGGLTISFNGNKYAVENAEVIVASENVFVISLLTYFFKKYGREKTLALVKSWSYEKIDELCNDEGLKDRINQIYSEGLPLVATKSENDVGKLVERNSYFRKKVRGKERGELG